LSWFQASLKERVAVPKLVSKQQGQAIRKKFTVNIINKVIEDIEMERLRAETWEEIQYDKLIRKKISWPTNAREAPQRVKYKM